MRSPVEVKSKRRPCSRAQSERAKKGVDEIPCSSDDSFNFGCAADIVMFVIREASEIQGQKVLTYLHVSTLNAKGHKTELSPMS